MEDTVEINYGVLSNAFFEDLDVEVHVRDSSGQLVDSITDRVPQAAVFPLTGRSTSRHRWQTSTPLRW